MKIGFLKGKSNGFISVLLAAIILTVSITSLPVSSETEDVLNSKVYSISSFTDGQMTDDFSQWSESSGFVDYTGSTSTVLDGVLSVTGGTEGNTWYSAHFNKTESLNQTVGVTFGIDNSSSAAAAVIWLRAGSYYRTNSNDFVPTGYYINCSRNSGQATVTLWKAHEDDRGEYTHTQIGSVASFTSSSSVTGEYLDITVEATAVYDKTSKSTVINVYVYEGTTMFYSAAFEDNESELKDAGKVGFAANNDSNLTVPFKSFSYHTTDNRDVFGYVTEQTDKADGMMVGLYTSIEPTSTYKFSVLVDASACTANTFNAEPLCIMYKGASNKGQQLTYTTTSSSVVKDGKYKKYTYTVTLPDGYVTESNTYEGTTSSNKGMTLIFVGYSMQDSAINNIKYANFELRKVKSNGTLGGNLLCNGDFKMGAYGWSENITPELWQVTPAGFDSTVMGESSSAGYSYTANKYEFWKNFIYPNYVTGGLNSATGINICDLVCYDELNDYSIFADMDRNGVLDYNDENSIKSAILDLQNILDAGNKKIAEIDNEASKRKAEILSTPSNLSFDGARVFYVSEDGDDSNIINSENSPWKTIDKVNKAVANRWLPKKYVICFKRGDTFRGQIVPGSNVTYTAYGDGAKPIITVSPEINPSNWETVDSEKNIYRYNILLPDVGSIFFNGGETYAAKRVPNIMLDDSGNYSYEYGYEALEDNQFISLPDAATAVTLNTSNASEVKGYVYLRCDSGNPGKIYDSIEFNLRLNVISPEVGAQDITIDNIALKFGGAHGFGGNNISENLVVSNCEIAYIGGGIHTYSKNDNGDGTYTYVPTRFGNGVEVTTACNGYTVNNCYVHDIYDAGLTHQTGTNHSAALVFKNVSYINNVIENCIYSIEYFARTGSKETATMTMDNILIENNIMRNAGSGFGVTRTMQPGQWNMSAHIMGWYSSQNILKDGSSFVIKNNTFDRSIYSNPTGTARVNSSFILVSAENSDWLPVFSGNTYINYMDNTFAYYGINAKSISASYLTKYSPTNDLQSIIGDTDGEFYFTEKK